VRLLLSLLLTAFAGVQLAGCGSGKLEEQDEAVRLAWADTINQYQRRIDLVPDLLSLLPLLAEREPRIVAAVFEAHANAQAVAMAPAMLDDPAAFERAQSNQMALGAALRELVATADRQPELAADERYRDLRAQLHGLDGRIAMARKRYAEAVQAYNGSVNDFPTSLTAGMFDYEEKPAPPARTEMPESWPALPGGETPRPLVSN
jgi:LemA protein